MRVSRYGWDHHVSAREYIEDHPITLALILCALLAFAVT